MNCIVGPSLYSPDLSYHSCDFVASLQVNIEELFPTATAGYPTPEMVECLKQISELSAKHNEVQKHLASVVESQQKIAREVSAVEQALPQKVGKEDLNIPDDLQEQLALLKQGRRQESCVTFISNNNFVFL